MTTQDYHPMKSEFRRVALKHRAMFYVIAVLIVLFMLEPSIDYATGVCIDYANKLLGVFNDELLPEANFN